MERNVALLLICGIWDLMMCHWCIFFPKLICFYTFNIHIYWISQMHLQIVIFTLNIFINFFPKGISHSVPGSLLVLFISHFCCAQEIWWDAGNLVGHMQIKILSCFILSISIGYVFCFCYLSKVILNNHVMIIDLRIYFLTHSSVLFTGIAKLYIRIYSERLEPKSC